MATEKDSCKECKFYIENEHDDIGFTEGSCVRYPPNSTGVPLVDKNFWCGEFVPKKSKLTAIGGG